MQDGFIKVAAVTPKIKVADTVHNAKQIIEGIAQAEDAGARIIVFPELCITAYTCSDLFLQEQLLEGAEVALLEIAAYTGERGSDALIFVGLPIQRDGKLYNVAAVIQNGEILAFIPKTHIPNYSEFYEQRHFAKGNGEAVTFSFHGREVPFGTNILLDLGSCIRGLQIGCEICEDAWVPNTPGTQHALHGATLLVNLSASNDHVGKAAYRRELIRNTSARLLAGYIYTSAGEGESTTDLVFGGHDMICENGALLAESKLFSTGVLTADLDISRLLHERRRETTFTLQEDDLYIYIPVQMERKETKLERSFAPHPFVPSDVAERDIRCEEILSIQAMGLKKRLEATGCKCAVLGISGGLDSTLALLVTAKAFDSLGLDKSGILAVTMPGFGTTDRTYQNACQMAKPLGATLMEVDIRNAVNTHFRDIAQDPTCHDVTYENSQARERTQVLMDLANKNGGMVIGTGDLSELALGWATYNGDHMSMYAVNVSVPKTLIRHLVRFYADTCGDAQLTAILLDVLDTPVSPELLPPEEGQISQKTEELVGPYELHDFFLYYLLRLGFSPRKIYRIAVPTFAGMFDAETIKKWLQIFLRRFFSQQFKRSCLPDGPKVGSVTVSPRGDLRMPSDVSAALWLREVEEI